MTKRVIPFAAPRLVVVEWEDSRQASGAWRWLADFEPQPPVRCLTAGFQLAATPETVTIAASVGDVSAAGAEQAAAVIEIPRSAVRRIVPLIASSASRSDGGRAT